MTEPLTVQDSWGRQALDTRQAYERFQFSVKSGCAVSINTGTLGQTDTLSVASGTVYFNGSSVSVSSQNAQIDAANASHPRKDVVYIDTNGDAQVAKGTAEAQQPDSFSGDTWEETYRPAPEDLSSTNAVVLAEVWVGAGVSSLGANLSTASNAVRDRRLNADLVLNTLTTEQADVESEPASYHIHTDGTDIWATPQQNPSQAAFSEVTGTDIGVVLESVIVDELPPQGSRKEAAGLIVIKAGDYPGDLSNATGDNGVVLPASCHIRGEGRTHIDDTQTNSNTPQTVPLTKLNYTDRGFVAPNVDTDLVPFAKVENIQLHGPGPGVVSSTAMDNRGHSNEWDKLTVKDCIIQRSDVSFDFTDSHDVKVINTHPVFCSKLFTSNDKFWAEYCHFYSKTTGSKVQTNGGQYSSDFFTNCIFGLSPGSGVANLEIAGSTVTVYVNDCHFQNLNSSAGYGIRAQSGVGRPSEIKLDGVTFQDGDVWDDAIHFAANIIKPRIAFCYDESDSTNSITLDGTNGLNSPILYGNRFKNGVNETGAVKRPRYEGVVLTTSDPSASNYGDQDRGLRIVRTDTQEQWTVKADGTLLKLPSNAGQSYTPSNVTTDRTFDANNTTTAELADVLGTLISDLETAEILNS